MGSGEGRMFQKFVGARALRFIFGGDRSAVPLALYRRAARATGRTP